MPIEHFEDQKVESIEIDQDWAKQRKEDRNEDSQEERKEEDQKIFGKKSNLEINKIQNMEVEESVYIQQLKQVEKPKKPKKPKKDIKVESECKISFIELKSFLVFKDLIKEMFEHKIVQQLIQKHQQSIIEKSIIQNPENKDKDIQIQIKDYAEISQLFSKKLGETMNKIQLDKPKKQNIQQPKPQLPQPVQQQQESSFIQTERKSVIRLKRNPKTGKLMFIPEIEEYKYTTIVRDKDGKEQVVNEPFQQARQQFLKSKSRAQQNLMNPQQQPINQQVIQEVNEDNFKQPDTNFLSDAFQQQKYSGGLVLQKQQKTQEKMQEGGHNPFFNNEEQKEEQENQEGQQQNYPDL